VNPFLGHIVAAFYDAKPDALYVPMRRIQKHVNHAKLERPALCLVNQAAVFARREHSLHAHSLMRADRRFKPGFDAPDGLQIGELVG
jgi:hypothetical protein